MPSLGFGTSVRRLMPLVLGTAALALVWGRFVVEARRAVGGAEVALAAGDRVEAERCYLDALRAYVPGSPYEQRALDGLARLASEAQDGGDPVAERRALEAMRSGLLGTRGIVIPHRARLAPVEERLQTLDADAGGAAPVAVMGPLGRGLGHAVGGRGTGWPSSVLSTLIALIGLATWVAAVALVVRSGLEQGRGPAPAPGAAVSESASARAPGPGRGWRLVVPVLFVVGVALFLIGLGFA
jgi:hypothetical protein